MIIQREWTEKDEKELNEAITKVERLRSKKAIIERIRKKQWEDSLPSRYILSKPSKLKCTF